VVSIIRPLPPKAAPLIRSDFRCTEMVKYYQIVSLKRGHLSQKAIIHYRTGCIEGEGATMIKAIILIKLG
jgi:hypothetical protein